MSLRECDYKLRQTFGDINNEAVPDIVSAIIDEIVEFPDDIANLFFDWVDLYDGIRIAQKYRQEFVVDPLVYITMLQRAYPRVYTCLKSRTFDIRVAEEIETIHSMMRDKGMLPTVDELDRELASVLSEMTTEERAEFDEIWRVYYRPGD